MLPRACLAVLLAVGAAPLPAVPAAAAPAGDCASEAAALGREEGELPRLDVASPADRPPYCITLEANIAFVGRVKAHVARCPGSPYAASASAWEKRRADYAKLFGQRRCRRTQ
jgi:hypothetical protein